MDPAAKEQGGAAFAPSSRRVATLRGQKTERSSAVHVALNCDKWSWKYIVFNKGGANKSYLYVLYRIVNALTCFGNERSCQNAGLYSINKV